MQVVVPSMGRTFDLRTIHNLVGAGIAPIVVVPPNERKSYIGALAGVVGPANIMGCSKKGIALTRQWIMENITDDKIVMVDDDLSFHVRRMDDQTKFQAATSTNIRNLFKVFDKHLTKYAHVSMIGRQGGNRILTDQLCSRPWHVFGFNKKLMPSNVKFGAGLLQDDFDMTLKLLRAGLPNYVMAGWAVNQHNGHGAPGGAACYRTVDDHNRSILELQAAHPEFVAVRRKEYKRGDPLGSRLEATIGWKKAYKSSGGVL